MTINGMTIDGGSIDGAAALDEAAYQYWLRDPNAAVAHLVRINYHGNSAVYPSWITYTLYTSDWSLPGTGYVGRVKSIQSFQRQIGADFTGAVAATYGSIEFHNEDGALDLWPNLAVDGQTVEVLHGDPAWVVDNDVSRFRLLFRCVAEKFTGSTADTLTLQLRGVDYKSDQPIQTDLLTNAANNSTSNLPIPLGYGNVFNATPPVVDSANQVHQWNDGAVTSVDDVRDGGVRFRTAQIAISAVNAGTDTLSTATAHGFVVGTRVRRDYGSLPAALDWSLNCWNGSIFCAVAINSNSCATSRDGVYWTQHTLPATADWIAIKWNGTVFCLIANTGGVAATSPDGITWTARTMPASVAWCSLAWSGALFCAVATSYGNVATSPDGITWTLRAIGTTDAWHTVIWATNTFYIFGGTDLLSSSDCITWLTQSYFADSPGDIITWTGTMFLSVTQGTNTASRAVDPSIWVNHTLPSTQNWTCIGWNGSIAVAFAPGVSATAYTQDGVTWTAGALTATANWSAVAFDGSILCLVASASATVLTSSDGTTWSPLLAALPAPLAISTDYWVIADGLTTTSFKLSATRGGNAIDITNTTTGGALIGYHWTADLATGKIYLDQKPAGTLTFDGVAGSTDAATIVIAALDAVDVDPASVRRFQSTCSQQVGIYVAERRNRLDVAADILSGLGAWYGRSREGMLQFGRIEGNPTEYDAELNVEDLINPFSFVLDEIIPPRKMHRIGYRKNWTKGAPLFAAVSADNRALYSGEYSVSLPIAGTDTGATGSFHALAQKPDVIPSMMTYSSDAQTEAARRNAMYFGWGAIYSCDAGLIGSLFSPGMVLKVTHSRFGLSGGVNMTVILTDDQPTNKTTKLKLFVALATYAPGQI